MAMLEQDQEMGGAGRQWGGSLINRLFANSHQTRQHGPCFPLLRGELRSAQEGQAMEWQFPVPKRAQCLASPHTTGLHKEERGNSSVAHTCI